MSDIIYVCDTATYHPGDPRPDGYLEFAEWARVQNRAGLRQTKCSKCGRWEYPKEQCQPEGVKP